MHRICQNCIYYWGRMDEEEGDCRINPPVVFHYDETTLPYADWPVTYFDCWCGKGVWRTESGDLVYWDDEFDEGDRDV